ncbi:MAG: HD domain-containing protein [Desulfovibrionaceae bacterium]|nr:HD domain-containing protein [Desulfovibrionaceae bacterium]
MTEKGAFRRIKLPAYAAPNIPEIPQLWNLPQTVVPPDAACCRRLWDKYAMPDHIRAHCTAVAEIAVCLARRALAMNLIPASSMLEAMSLSAGLLHDLAKSYSVRYGGSHAQLGASWVLQETGQYLVAQAVYYHVDWFWPLPKNLLHPVFLLIYADKRVCHDTVVSLQERFDDLLIRYGKTQEAVAAMKRNFDTVLNIEQMLSKQLEINLHESTFIGGRMVQRA